VGNRIPTTLILKDRAVNIWTARFGCTKQQLEKAVRKVGSESGAVRAELGRRVPLRRSRRSQRQALKICAYGLSQLGLGGLNPPLHVAEAR